VTPSSSLAAFYQDKITTAQTRIGLTQTRINAVAIGRLVAFLGLAVAIYYQSRYPSTPLLITLLLLAVLFIFLVRIHLQLKDQQALWEQLLLINTNEHDLLDNKPNRFPDGAAFLNSESYLDDLDVFGPASLFHMLNRTTTSHGLAALADLLRHPLRRAPDILDEQAAIRSLAGQTDIRQLLTAKGRLAGETEGTLQSLESWLSTPSLLYSRRGWRFFLPCLALYNMASLLLYLITDNYHPLLAGIALSWLFVGIHSKYINSQHTLISRKQAVLDQYASILSVFNTASSQNAARLQRLQTDSVAAHTAIRRLSRLAAFFDQRINVVVNILLNSLFAYDLHCMIALEKWKETNKTAFPRWVTAVGDIERLNSLATFAFNNPEYAYPTPLEPAASGLLITATQVAHPLIPQKERVANDFTIGRDDRLVLVTGSNMSGKTTFLRTLGINLLLAECGTPVCAESFSFTPMHLLTSLRISDSLQEHTSYFMAELKKLQRIIHRLEQGEPALVLIDEILRGTNSEDKTYGSEQFIRKLVQHPCLSLFATHDLTLGSLEEEMPGIIRNYCFESVIEEGNLYFNYRLQQGIARNRNASFLMKKMDII